MMYRVNNQLINQLCLSPIFGEESAELQPEAVLETISMSLEQSQPISIIMSIGEVDLIESIIEILTFNSFRSTPLVRLIVISKLNTWNGTIFRSNAENLLDIFCQRTQCHGQFELSSVESSLFHATQAGKAIVNVAYVGELFGGIGYDHKELFRSAWDSCVPNVPSLYQNAVIPVAHINQASTLLNGLVKSDSRSFINFLFDIHSVSLSNFMSNFVDKTNAAYAETDNGHNPYAALLKDSVSIDWLKGLQHIQTVEAHPILQTFSSVWNEFVQSNGLSPVHLAVVGPPKSGKTNLAKTISSMLQVSHLDAMSCVRFVFNYSPGVYPEDLCGDYLESSRLKIISVLEQKFIDGLAGKKGKDKSPVESKLDEASITDTFCSTLPGDILLESIAFRSFLDSNCRKKGYMLDCWERDIFVGNSLIAFQNCTKGEFFVPCRLIIRKHMEKQKILDKQMETMGPQAVKSKEGQAMLKSLEAALDSYFQSAKPDHGGRPLDVTASGWVENGWVTVCDLESELEEETTLLKTLVKSLKQTFGFIPGWISFQDDENDNGQIANEIFEQNMTSEESVTVIHNASNLDQSDDCVRKYADFLTATVMGVLAKGLVSVTRENPRDPIKELAKILNEASDINQRDSYENAKIAFEHLLQTS